MIYFDKDGTKTKGYGIGEGRDNFKRILLYESGAFLEDSEHNSHRIDGLPTPYSTRIIPRTHHSPLSAMKMGNFQF